jgi:hypothetical protein
MFIYVAIALIVLIITSSSFFRTVPQATVRVVTVFGKYRRIMREGLALFRKNIAVGMKEAADSLKSAGVDTRFLLFLEYTDALKYVADHSQGKVIFMDNGASAPAKVTQGLFGMLTETPGGAAPAEPAAGPAQS